MAKTLSVEIVMPDRSVFRGEAVRFRAPGVEGAFEILPNHAAMLAVTDVGAVYVTTPSGERIRFATSGGFVEVFNNRIIMLAETAEPASDIDLERAKTAEERARTRLDEATGEERVTAEVALERARNRVRVSMGSVGTRTP